MVLLGNKKVLLWEIMFAIELFHVASFYRSKGRGIADRPVEATYYIMLLRTY